MYTPVVTVVKEFSFDSAHYLQGYRGKCANIHGHTYKLLVGFRGKLNKEGFVIDFHDIEKVVGDTIIASFDHKLINDVRAYNPTAENMAVDIYDNLATCFAGFDIKLDFVRLYESDSSFAEYRGLAE